MATGSTSWFEKISEGLTEQQKADLKRKFSRMDALSKTGQAIRAKAFDISEHYRQHWQGTGSRLSSLPRRRRRLYVSRTCWTR